MKIKNVDNVSWVNLATYKKSDRPMIARPLRDTTSLVATNGHRLHILNGLSEVEKPHIIGDVLGDYIFPEYKKAIPDPDTQKIIGRGIITGLRTAREIPMQ
jgi:hypothetical protein